MKQMPLVHWPVLLTLGFTLANPMVETNVLVKEQQDFPSGSKSTATLWKSLNDTLLIANEFKLVEEQPLSSSSNAKKRNLIVGGEEADVAEYPWFVSSTGKCKVFGRTNEA